jgi:hypothetical protein
MSAKTDKENTSASNPEGSTVEEKFSMPHSRLAAARQFGVGFFAGIFSSTWGAIIAAVLTLLLVWAVLPGSSSSRVSFEHGRVVEKNWYTNWLWRSDPSKVFKVDTKLNHNWLPFSGQPAVEVDVSATRANGETSVYAGNGVWHVKKN